MLLSWSIVWQRHSASIYICYILLQQMHCSSERSKSMSFLRMNTKAVQTDHVSDQTEWDLRLIVSQSYACFSLVCRWSWAYLAMQSTLTLHCSLEWILSNHHESQAWKAYKPQGLEVFKALWKKVALQRHFRPRILIMTSTVDLLIRKETNDDEYDGARVSKH